jgi:hypothetical protein
MACSGTFDAKLTSSIVAWKLRARQHHELAEKAMEERNRFEAQSGHYPPDKRAASLAGINDKIRAEAKEAALYTLLADRATEDGIVIHTPDIGANIDFKRMWGDLLSEAQRIGRCEFVRDRMAELTDSEIEELSANTTATGNEGYR